MKGLAGITTLALIYSLIAPQICAAEISPEENMQIGTAVRKLYKLKTKATRLESPALEKVTDAALYNVKVTIVGPDSNTLESVKVVKRGDQVSTIRSPSTNQECPGLKALLKKGFTLKTDDDAKAIETVLDLLYPLSDSFGGKDKKAKATLREGKTVTFVRGEFFKDLKGYVFKTDENGSVQEVRYSLSIKRGGKQK